MKQSDDSIAMQSDDTSYIKDLFAAGELQALIAIRCLDEGVNIPGIKTAFILASSTNPKEYIQRRGRVLRLSPGKRNAVIYDFITLPFTQEEATSVPLELLVRGAGLAAREITRMDDFARIAENPSDSDFLVSDIKALYQIKGTEEEALI